MTLCGSHFLKGKLKHFPYCIIYLQTHFFNCTAQVGDKSQLGFLEGRIRHLITLSVRALTSNVCPFIEMITFYFGKLLF